MKHPKVFAYIYHHVKIATFISRLAFQNHPNKGIVDESCVVTGGPTGHFRDAGFATFGDGISGNWVLKLRETGLDIPTGTGIS